VVVESVERIERTERGKFRAVVSLLPANIALEFAGPHNFHGHDHPSPDCNSEVSFR
jgi:hypothetical protein